MLHSIIIPDNWQEVKVKDISLRIHYGYTASSVKKNTGTKLLRITDIQNYKVNWADVPYCEVSSLDIEKFLLKEDDIVFARTGATVGKSFLLQGSIPQAVFASYLIRIQLSKYVNPRYLYYFFQSADYWKQIGLKAIGIGQPNVNANSLSNISLLLCSHNEQNHIVEKIEELFSELENVGQSLLDIKKRLDIYWRGVLKAIYEKENTVNYIRLGKISNITMGQSPHGSTYNDKGIGMPLINGPVEFGETSFSKTVLSKWTTKPTKTCNEGDIIICVRGSTTGRLNIAGFDACIGRGVAAIKSKEKVINEYLLYFLHYKEKSILEMGTGTTFPSISKELLYDLLIPKYSKEEQIEIVNTLDCKYTIIENASDIITKKLHQIEVLKQSILSKAFNGKLVPQNPNDEPASELLKKIKEERLEFLQNKPTVRKFKNKIIKMERIKSVLELLEEAQEPLLAKNVWEESKHWENIDDFYTEIKKLVEDGEIEELPRKGKESFLKLARK